MTEVTHIRIPAWIKEAARNYGRQEQRGINDQLIYWMRAGMPRHLSERYEPPTAYERATKRIDELIDQGRNAPPGIREAKFSEAEQIRESLDNMTVEDAEARS